MSSQPNQKNNNYISLQEASKFCEYSQEYLSLRARQGKLQSAKLGRNWVTTKEWLDEYLQKVEEWNGRVRSTSEVFSLTSEVSKRVPVPENLPVEEPKRFLTLSLENVSSVLVAILITVLITAGGVFGKESLKQVYNEIDGQVSTYSKITKEAGLAALEKVGRQTISVEGQELTIEAAAAGISNLWQGYSDWMAERLFVLWQAIQESQAGQNYIALNDMLEEGLFRDIKTIARGYSSANNFLDEKIGGGVEMAKKSFGKIKDIVIAPWTREVIREVVIEPEIEIEDFSRAIEELKSELEQLKKEPFVVKRVEVERMVEQVREITREVERVEQVTKIDDEALKTLRQNIAYLEEEIGKRLYAPGGVITQQIYITEPVMSPKIYQEHGEIVLQTLGSGNVILSAATGLQLHGQQVVIESTSLLNPLIYLASNTRIGGDVTVTGSISGGALSVSSAAISGDATVGGSLTVSGDLTVSGAQSYSGAAVFTASSTEPALKVIQNGTGNIVQFLDGGTNIFTISDGGYTSLATSPSVTNPVFLFQTTDTTNWATGTATFLGINATSTFNGNFLDFQKNGISLFSIASDGSLVSSASITAATFVSADDDSTVRKSGEEIFREVMPVDRYDIPAQTGTTTYFRISKYFAANPLSSTPEPLPGADRVYKLIIKFADDIPTNSSSSWRIYQRDGVTTSDTFTLLGQNMSSLAEGIATTTKNLTIPDTDWQVEVKLSEDDSGKAIRIFQIFLAAYDKIN